MEFSFKDIMRIIKKNIIFIVAVTLAFAVCSFLGTKFLVQKTYTTSVKLYVSTSYDISSGYDSLQSHNYAQNIVLTYIEMLDSNRFYTAVAEKLENKYTASELDNIIGFTSVENTEVFNANVSCNSPEEAKKIADAVAQTAPETIALLKSEAQLKIVDEAVMPVSPASPSVSRNVMVAFMAGLILSLIIVFVRDYFDVKIKYNEEMTTLCKVPVLGAIPDFELYTHNIKSKS